MGYKYQYYRLIKIGWEEPSHKGKVQVKPISRKKKKRQRRVVKSRKGEPDGLQNKHVPGNADPGHS